MEAEVQQAPTSVKYDWYQSETHVVITILAKNVLKDKTRIEFQEQALNVHLALPNGTEHVRKLKLAHVVDPKSCSYFVGSTKVEVKLKKVDGIRWSNLEYTVEEIPMQIPQASCATTASSRLLSYPTSKPGRDWSLIEREIKEQEAKEKPEADEALNKLFQDIYSKGDDSVKRAMNKSYMESSGTVLSTNWGEISQKEVNVQPPDGMEYKKWDS